MRVPVSILAAAALSACAAFPPPPAPVVIGTSRAVSAELPTLTNSEWSVLSVNGEPTPVAGNYSMEFRPDGQMSARFGCNHMGGTYRVERAQVTISGLSQTLMGCPEPASRFERLGGAVLGQPMRIARDPQSGGVALSNEAGTVVLVPIVAGRRL